MRQQRSEIMPTTGFENLDQVLQQVEDYRQEALAACTAFVEGEAELIMQRADEIVPRETGELAESAFIEEPVQSGDMVSVTMGFAAEHAKVVHERLDVHHPNGKQAKYLETAVYQAADGAPRRMADIVQEHLHGRGLG
jgi:hypothetical protein